MPSHANIFARKADVQGVWVGEGDAFGVTSPSHLFGGDLGFCIDGLVFLEGDAGIEVLGAFDALRDEVKADATIFCKVTKNQA